MNFTQRTRHFFILSLFRFISWLPAYIQKGIAFLIFVLLAYVVKYRKKVIYQNLINSFPEKSDGEIKKIAVKYYRNLSYMFIEDARLGFIDPAKIPGRLTINNSQVIEELRNQNRNILAVIGHLSNWEYGSMFANLFNYNGYAVYKKLADPVFDKIYFDIRSHLGAIPVEMHNVARTMVDLNKSNKPFMLFLIADQSPMKHEITHWLPFLNQDTGVYLGPEKLAQKYNMPVVYLELIRNGFDKFDLNIELVTNNPKQTKPYEIIEQFYRILESRIRSNPDQWLWSHRRWKHKNPNTTKN
jgi:Kdo2-lipid IVA lauroyltransferase/acyltransferase